MTCAYADIILTSLFQEPEWAAAQPERGARHGEPVGASEAGQPPAGGQEALGQHGECGVSQEKAAYGEVFLLLFFF